MEQLDLKVGGMTCGGCVNSVTRALHAVPGVKKAEVDLAAGQAKVSYDAAQTSPAALRQAIEAAGFEVD